MLAAGRELEQLREPSRRSSQRVSPSWSCDGRRERDARLARGAGERGGADARRVDAQRQRRPGRRCGRATRARRRASSPRRRGRGRARRARARRRRSGRARTIAASAARGRRPSRSGRARTASAPLRTRRRRRHVGAEDVDVEALEAAERAEAVALALRRVDAAFQSGSTPSSVGADREALAGGDEDDRLSGRARPTCRSSSARASVASRPPTSIPSIRTPLGDRRRRAGEDEPEHDADADDRRPRAAAAGARATACGAGATRRESVRTGAPVDGSHGGRSRQGRGPTLRALYGHVPGSDPGQLRQKTKSSTPPRDVQLDAR